MERRPDAAIAPLMRKDLMHPLLVEQVAGFDLADGGAHSAGVEEHGEGLAIAAAAQRVGWGGAVEEHASYFAGEPVGAAAAHMTTELRAHYVDRLTEGLLRAMRSRCTISCIERVVGSN
jgi:hypothetical protein